MAGVGRFVIPDGWVAQGWRFEVETTTPVQRSLIQQHFGARRFAYNWALTALSLERHDTRWLRAGARSLSP